MHCWSYDQAGSSVHYCKATVTERAASRVSCQVTRRLSDLTLSHCVHPPLSLSHLLSVPPGSQTSDIFAMIERMQVRSPHFHPVCVYCFSCNLLLFMTSDLFITCDMVTPSQSLLIITVICHLYSEFFFLVHHSFTLKCIICSLSSSVIKTLENSVRNIVYASTQTLGQHILMSVETWWSIIIWA